MAVPSRRCTSRATGEQRHNDDAAAYGQVIAVAPGNPVTSGRAGKIATAECNLDRCRKWRGDAGRAGDGRRCRDDGAGRVRCRGGRGSGVGETCDGTLCNLGRGGDAGGALAATRLAPRVKRRGHALGGGPRATPASVGAVKRWPRAGLKGWLSGGTSQGSAAFAVAEAGGWMGVIEACNAAQEGQARAPDAVGKGGRR